MVTSMLSLRGQALALLARREHSRSELRRKLLAHARKRLAAGLPLEGSSTASAGDADPDTPANTPSAPDAFLGGPVPRTESSAEASTASHEACGEAVELLLDWLSERQYLSDTRFIECRVNTRSARLGTSRIRQELAQHGLRLDADAVTQLRSTEMARAQAVWLRRFGQVADDAKERARQMRFLAGRGFAADVVRRVVGGEDPQDA